MVTHLVGSVEIHGHNHQSLQRGVESEAAGPNHMFEAADTERKDWVQEAVVHVSGMR